MQTKQRRTILFIHGYEVRILPVVWASDSSEFDAYDYRCKRDNTGWNISAVIPCTNKEGYSVNLWSINALGGIVARTVPSIEALFEEYELVRRGDS